MRRIRKEGVESICEVGQASVRVVTSGVKRCKRSDEVGRRGSKMK